MHHQVTLFHADAMLARQAAAGLNTDAQDFSAQSLGCFELTGIGIKDDQRMHIAIARMKDIRDGKAVLFAQIHDLR